MKPGKLLFETADSKIYDLEDSSYYGKVIIKVLESEYWDPVKSQQLLNEYDITHELNIPGVRKAFKSLNIDSRPAIVLQFIEGRSIKEILTQQKLSLKEFLTQAISISKVLFEIHDNRIIHKDINSKNILIENHSGNVYFIDFGISSKLTLKTQQLINPGKLEGSIAYMSPEQTGRMNRAVDYRSDFYSLGVMFYEMLCGKLPFETTDPVELVHCHIAKNPIPVNKVNPEIPPKISEILEKLMAKNAEDRYQNALGLRYDLQQCLNMLESSGKIADFKIASHDYSGQFHIPQKLYGRKRDIEILKEHFNYSLEKNHETIIISGYSGIGKTALVHELHRSVTETGSIFIEGKFNQYQRNTPYLCFIEAFNSLINLLLTESEGKLAEWKKKFNDALGEHGGLLTELLPKLELIIGKQPEPDKAGASESLNRFNYTFTKFLKCISGSVHNLTIFADDLQWADSASLSLIKQIASEKTIENFFFIAAYRDNEVDQAHPWHITLNEIKNSGTEITEIRLLPLNEENVNQLVSDTLSQKAADCAAISGIIYTKTKGNPFFVNEFFKSLYTNGYISWDSSLNQWNRDDEKIESLDVTDNVVYFLLDRLKQLPSETFKLLQHASCIGTNFSLGYINEIFNSGEDIQSLLNNSLEAGYIIPYAIHSKSIELNGHTNIPDIIYKFSHDRVQQAVYSSLSKSELEQVHFKIGHYLQQRNDSDENLFQIADHFNNAGNLPISSSNAENKLAELNYNAGEKAKKNNAHDLALHYFQTANRFLNDDSWNSDFGLMFNVILSLGEEYNINRNEPESERLLDMLLSKARNNVEKIRVYEKKVLLYAYQGHSTQALEAGRKALSLVNINLPSGNITKKVAIGWQLLKASRSMKNKSINDILDLPEINSEEAKAVSNLVGYLFQPLYYADSELFIFMALYMVGYSLKYGNSVLSPLAYVSLGIVNAALLQNYKQATELYEISWNLNRKNYNSVVKGRLMLNYLGGIQHWKSPAYEAIDNFYECYKVNLENGDLIYAGDTINTMFSKHLYIAKNLPALKEEFTDYGIFLERIHNFTQQQDFKAQYRFIEFLISEKENKTEIEDFEKNFQQDNSSAFSLGFFFTYMAFYHYLMGNYEKSLKMANSAVNLKQGFAASICENQAILMQALALSATIPSNPGKSNNKSLKILNKRLKQFKKWEDNCPANFSHGASLIAAEISRIKGKNDVIDYFRKAIEHSGKHHYTQMNALANELAGKYSYEAGMIESSNGYFRDALRMYSKWGATVKVNQMLEKYPQLKSDNISAKNISLEESFSHSSTRSGNVLDVLTIVKACTAISSEIKVDKLLSRLLEILIENAGAQRAVFIVVSDQGYLYKTSEDTEDQTLRELDETNVKLFPQTMSQYVYRTGETIVIEDASKNIQYGSDPYIQKNRSKSVLFLPITSKGKIIAELYLENNLLTGAFGPNRLELLRMLSGQIAISLENAMLYENLEDKVEERTREINQQKEEIENQKKLIEKEKQKSDELLLNILPEDTAEELKKFGKAKARRYDNVSVMFADIIAFTKHAEQLGAEELVSEIDTCFRAFDEILEKHNIEKIKTIGDAYMCAGGINNNFRNSAANIVKAALEMQGFMNHMKTERAGTGKPVFEMRVGIHTGPVVAGVVGSKKFAYDIWGDTVNMAARMEQSGKAGKVNISGDTYELIKDRFECNYRGKVEAKNKGVTDMYFVETSKKAEEILTS